LRIGEKPANPGFLRLFHFGSVENSARLGGMMRTGQASSSPPLLLSASEPDQKARAGADPLQNSRFRGISVVDARWRAFGGSR